MIGLDSAIKMSNVRECQIISCRLIDSLYGIDMAMVNNSLISDNYITSRDNLISLKGDGLKMWYADNNIIQNNTFDNLRDVTLTHSHSNIIKNNTFTNNRFALHVSLCDKNKIRDNTFKYNSVSIMIMGAKDTLVKHNLIQSSKGAAGIGVVIKGVSHFRLEDNTIRYNAQAIYIDSKAKERGMQRYFINNDISYNKEALHFHALIKNNTIKHNKIYANIEDVIKDIEGVATNSNIIQYNYWDRYTGFDRDGDNIGDTPHCVYQYADRLWHYNNKIKFFYASPIISLLNFLTAVAPFIEPNLLLEDKYPLLKL
jgi:nitrous oxidase accessory protein